MSPVVTQKIRVENLSAMSSDSALHSMFAKYGAVMSCDRPLDPETNLPGKLALIEISADGVDRAVAALDGTHLDGQELHVSVPTASKPAKTAKAVKLTKTATAAKAIKPANAAKPVKAVKSPKAAKTSKR